MDCQDSEKISLRAVQNCLLHFAGKVSIKNLKHFLGEKVEHDVMKSVAFCQQNVDVLL